MTKAPKLFKKLCQQVVQANNPNILISKLCLIFFLGFLILLQVFLLREALNGENDNALVANSSFISIRIARNSGLGFSLLKDKTALVYFLQGFLSAVALLSLIFIKNYHYVFWVSTLAWGAVGNFLDRIVSGNNTVLDYFVFNNGGSVFNFADSCITFSFIGLFLTFLVQMFREARQKETL